MYVLCAARRGDMHGVFKGLKPVAVFFLGL